MVEVLDPEKLILKEIEEQEWLRLVVSGRTCQTPEETAKKVKHLTVIGNNIALLERQLYSIQHKDDEM